jgi:ATP-binding cassette subfamily B (MDR/TAP) protein 10
MAPVQSKDLVPSANSSGNSNAVITKPKVSRYQTFKRLLSFASPDLSKIIIGILALAVNGATNLSFPWIIGKAVDNAAAETLKEFVTNSAGFFVAGALASWLRVYCLGIAGENISNRLRLEVFNAILKQEIEYYESTELGEIVSLLDTDIHVSSSLLTETISSILRSFNSAVNGSVLLYRTSPSLCAVSLSVAPVVGVAGMGFAIYSSKLTKASRNFQSQISSHSLERFRNISTVRLNNRENYEISHLSKLLEESHKLANKRYHASGSFMSFTNIATNCSLIAVLRYGGLMISRGELSVGTLTSFAIQTAFVGLGFSGLATAYSSFIKGLDATER